MKVLVICIEVLFGHYFINIYSDYIITYRVEENSTKKLDVNIINMNSELMYSFKNDSNEISKVSNVVYDKSNSDFVLLESKVINSIDNYMSFNCEVNLSKYTFNDSVIIKIEDYYTGELLLIDKYIKIDRYKQKLPFIGSGFKEMKKYLLKSEDVTHSEPILISKLVYIKEKKFLDKDLSVFLNDIKNYPNKQ